MRYDCCRIIWNHIFFSLRFLFISVWLLCQHHSVYIIFRAELKGSKCFRLFSFFLNCDRTHTPRGRRLGAVVITSNSEQNPDREPANGCSFISNICLSNNIFNGLSFVRFSYRNYGSFDWLCMSEQQPNWRTITTLRLMTVAPDTSSFFNLLD